ncbi:MAG: peptide ABC transporter substrate-binding protein [Chloroflexi bacterium]|nr:peptide ABC transporter substrate-binding protein [Chloroflexota bacterium]
MRWRIIAIAVTLGLLVTLLAAACGQAAKPAGTPVPTKAATEAPKPTPQAKAAPQGKAGGVFRRLWADPPTLDPALTSDTTSAGIVVEVFSGLVNYTPDLQLIPEIAESWDISPDGKTYTFHLRKSARFHDGKPVTARDFKYSLERAADPKTASPVADTYLGDIVGVRDKLKGKATEVQGVKVVDDSTLQLTIDAPKSFFIAKLTYPTSYVVDRENIEKMGARWTEKPNGTGPFILKEYKVGDRIVLARNPNYYLEPARIDGAEFILSGGTQMAMYENDEIHLSGVGLADLDRVKNPSDPLNKQLVVAPPGFEIDYIGFNVKLPPFDDPKVRQALNYAINKEVIAKEVLADRVVPAYGILPPGFPGFNPDLKGIRFDKDKAKDLLGQSRYAKNMPRIVLTVPGTGGSIGLDLEVILSQWKQNLGIQVELQQVEWATFLEDLNKQKLQVYSGLGWQADYPDPQDFLDVLFHSQSELNHGGYSNPELDRLLDEAAKSTDWNKRVELYNKAERIIVDDVAWVPLWYSGERLALVKPYIKGYKFTPFIISKLRYISIEK